MKLLYATSISFPSQYANRLQILANSEQFGKVLGPSFWLGADSLRSRDFPFQKIELGGPWKSPVLALKYLSIIKKNGITHVYTREDRLFFFLKMYARLMRLPLKFFFEAHTARSGFFLNRAVKRADGVIAITKGIKDDLALRGVDASKILVAHDAVDMSLFDIADSKQKLRSDFDIPVNAKVVAYVGKYTTMGKQKGVDELVEAFASAFKANSGLHLLIVGLSDAETPLLKAVCNEEGLPESSFTLVAHVPNAEVPKYMKTADMLVMNYPNTEHYARYMSPMKLFEYMAARIPIITTDLPSVREVLNDTEAFYVPAGDMGALKTRILEIAAHEKNASSKAEAAYKKVRADYTWDKRSQAILAFIQGKKNKKVLLVTHTLDITNGWGRYNTDLRTGLVSEGYDVICTADRSIQTIYSALRPPLSYLRSPLTFLKDIFRMRSILKSENPDIVHITIEPYMLLLPFLYVKNRKVIVTMHGTYSYFVDFAPKALHSIFRMLFARALLKVSHIITVSDFTRSHFLKRVSEEGVFVDPILVRTVHNGVRVSEYRYMPESSPKSSPTKRIISVGAVKPRKGFVESLHALAKYKRLFGDDFLFHWVGSYRKDDPYAIEVTGLIAKLRLQDQVRLLGRISEDELKAEYAAADAFMLLPVVIGGTQFEGFGLVYIEANACGIPVLASLGSGSAEAVKDGASGYVVDPYNAEQAARRLHEILNGSISRKAARGWAEEHDMSIVVGKVISMYNS